MYHRQTRRASLRFDVFIPSAIYIYLYLYIYIYTVTHTRTHTHT